MSLPFGKRAKEINKVVLLPIGQIHKSPHQPRGSFDEEALQDLARSIEANGLLQPVTVRRTAPGSYELVAGERRTLAFKRLGRNEIPAIIEECTPEQSAVFALLENLQRRDLNYFEEARGIEKLMAEYGLTQIQVCQRIGKAQSTVANKLRLLRFPLDLQQKMMESGLTERHARVLLQLPIERLDEAVAQIARKGLNVEQTEAFVQTMLVDSSRPTATRLFVIKDMRIFMNSIKKAVSTMNAAGIPIDTTQTEYDAFVEVRIKIPKSAVYKGASNY